MLGKALPPCLREDGLAGSQGLESLFWQIFRILLHTEWLNLKYKFFVFSTPHDVTRDNHVNAIFLSTYIPNGLPQ